MQPFSIAVCLTAVLIAQANIHKESYVLPVDLISGPVPNITTKVGSRPLDTLYITNPNSTSYEWWYFDAVAFDLSASIVLQPVNEGVFGLILGLSYANGTTSGVFQAVTNGTNFSAASEGSSMTAPGQQFSYNMAPDLSTVKWDLNVPSIGITGTVELESIAPPHVACSGIYDGANLEFFWDLLWVNPIPDAVARVNIEVNGTKIAFEGIGYHDKNWGATLFTTDLSQWYWGHGRADEYSVVWFYHLSNSGGVTASAYISKHGKIVYAACGDSVWVRTVTSEGIVYPISYGYNFTVLGVEVRIDAGKVGKFAFTATQKSDTVKTDVYTRWIGSFAGGLVGGKNSSGVAVWEMQGPYPPA